MNLRAQTAEIRTKTQKKILPLPKEILAKRSGKLRSRQLNMTAKPARASATRLFRRVFLLWSLLTRNYSLPWPWSLYTNSSRSKRRC